MLAHKATHDPEVAWIGLTETGAKAKGIEYDKAHICDTFGSRMSDANLALIIERTKADDGLHVLGCSDRPSTLFMQQCRAINLAWALREKGQLKPGSRIAVIGGGVGGLTAAAACRLLDCQVTVLERLDGPLALQRGNHTRFLHPRIYDWPEPGSTAGETDLPVLNWSAGLAGDVADTILRQWEDGFAGIDVDVRLNCARYRDQAQRESAAALRQSPSIVDLSPLPAPVAIVAVGFCIECGYLPDGPSVLVLA